MAAHRCFRWNCHPRFADHGLQFAAHRNDPLEPAGRIRPRARNRGHGNPVQPADGRRLRQLGHFRGAMGARTGRYDPTGRQTHHSPAGSRRNSPLTAGITCHRPHADIGLANLDARHLWAITKKQFISATL